VGCEDMSFTWEVVAGSSELETVSWGGRCEFMEVPWVLGRQMQTGWM